MIRKLSIIAASLFGIGSVACAQTVVTQSAPIKPAPSATLVAAEVKFGADGLPTGATHEVMTRVCSACHAPEVVTDKRMDYAGWDDVVQTMIGRGAQATPQEAKQITDYLAAGFPAK